MKIKVVGLFCLVAVIAAAAESGKHVITHEELWLLKRAGAPIPSPDGKWAVFSITEPAYDAKDQVSDLWLKSLTDDTPARRLTATKGAESGPDWSPDGRKIAFSAKREGDEANQLYIIDVAGGEAERVTNLTLGARQPKWSPDGKKLMFLSEVYPGADSEEAIKKAAKERKDRKYNARAYDMFPPRYWNRWLDDKRTHLFVQEARAGVPAKDLLAQSKVAAKPGFGGSFGDDGENIGAEWTPDGSAVVFAAVLNREEGARAAVSAQILQISAEGGEVQQLTMGKASYGSLSFSPDGKRLLGLIDAQVEGKVYDLSRLVSFPWPFRNEPQVLTASLDRSISSYAMPEGSDRIFLSYEHAGFEKIYSIAYNGGEVRPEASPANGCAGSLKAGGKALVGTWVSAVHPSEPFLFSGGSARSLAPVNEEKLAKLDLPPLEEFWFTSSRGKKLHNFIVKPAGFDASKKYPLLLVIHGGAASMWSDSFSLRWNFHLLASDKYVILLTDYTGSTGYGEEFARAIQFDPLKGPGQELNEAADEAIKKYAFIDASRQAAAGASYGGHLANWLQATTTRYKAIVSHAGEMDLIMQWGTSDGIFNREVNSGSPVWGDSKVWREQSPVMLAGNHDKGTGFLTPILITVGEQDFRVPMNNAIMNFAVQQRLNVPSRLLVFPEAFHWITRGEDSRYWYSEVHSWLAKYLK